MQYPDTLLHIDGAWKAGSARQNRDVVDPGSGRQIGRVAMATDVDIDAAAASASRGLSSWSSLSAFERSAVLHRAIDILSDRTDSIARLITLEQGKPLAEARGEIKGSCDVLRWFAEEATRVYGRLIPSRAAGSTQLVRRAPVGVVAAFTPWNYPVAQGIRKLGPALAAGCSVILKGAEETPASTAAMVQVFLDAGLPVGALNLLYGEPDFISERLIADPAVRKVSFTGSTVIGKKLAAQAGAQMKRITMELGGHAPAIVCGDADVDAAARMLAAHKYHNAGQVCIAPSRILVEEEAKAAFVPIFLGVADSVSVGNGQDEAATMGPLANERRLHAAERLVQDAVSKGAKLLRGGCRIGNAGNFFQPTVLQDVPLDAQIMHEEPFGPVAVINGFASIDAAIAEANRLDYGLAAYAFTRSQKTAERFSAEIETGMLSINHYGLAHPEVPFNGVKDSGYGSEGGPEALDAYLNTKFVSHLHI